MANIYAGSGTIAVTTLKIGHHFVRFETALAVCALAAPKRIRILADHAMTGTPRSSIADLYNDYYFLVDENYRMFYRAIGEEVYVDRVLYGRRDCFRVLGTIIVWKRAGNRAHSE